MTERLHFHSSLSCIGEGNGNPLQCSCLENPRDGGAWWAAARGVAKSRTRLSDFTFILHFHALEMATHSSVLAWRIPGMGGAWWARLKWLGSSSSSNKLLGFPGGASGKEPTCHCRLDPLEEDMTTHFCILAWRIPWAKEPGGLQSMRSYRVGTTEAT